MLDSRYSHDWTVIARNKKQTVNWICERCGVQCLRPGEGKGLSRSERYRLRMSVHHCDYDPGNNAPENLRALCSTCHLYYHHRQQGNVTPGQLSLDISKTYNSVRERL